MRLLWLIAVLALTGQDAIDEQIQEYRKYYKKGLSLAERVEAIHVLEECDRPEAAELLLDASTDPEFPVHEAALQVLGSFRSGPVVDLLVEVSGDKGATRSGRRAAAAEALGRIGDGRAVDTLIGNLRERDFEVRRASVVSLGLLRATTAIERLLPLLQDKEPALRVVTLDALGQMKSPEKTTTAVLALLEASEWQVRAAALGALRHSRPREAIQPLIGFLRTEEGRLREDALAALQEITGNEYHDDADLWQRWWDSVVDRWEMPTDADIERIRKARAENQLKYQGAAADFVGVPSKSVRMVFVVDVSGSMEELIQDKDGFLLSDRGFRSYQKMEIIKDELARTIEALDPGVRFNILSFATSVEPWKKGLVPANVVNRKGAVSWIRALKPIGGAAQGFRSRAGLSGSAGMSEGKTNTYEALMTALEAGGRGGYDKNYKSAVDTIYFLSDGVPTVGKFLEHEDILAEVQRVNSLRRITIHTIAIGEMEHHLMKALAGQNGGLFVDLGR